jgi:hypothetical protein
MGNSVTSQEKRRIQSVKRKQHQVQDQEATKEDTWSSNPSVEEDDRTQSCYRKKVGHLSQSFAAKLLILNVWEKSDQKKILQNNPNFEF